MFTNTQKNYILALINFFYVNRFNKLTFFYVNRFHIIGLHQTNIICSCNFNIIKLKAQLKHTLITIMVTCKFQFSPSGILLVTIRCLQ